MTEGTLYNGKQFPDYVFTDKVADYLFIEFDFLFSGEFWEIFKILLEENEVQKIVIENLQPNYHFVDEVNVKDLPQSFIASTRTEKLEGYFSFKASLYMITENTLIYSLEKKGLFCILLDRQYSLGILGFSNLKRVDLVNELGIQDISDYLTLSFAGRDLPNSFKDILYRNWSLPL